MKLNQHVSTPTFQQQTKLKPPQPYVLPPASPSFYAGVVLKTRGTHPILESLGTAHVIFYRPYTKLQKKLMVAEALAVSYTHLTLPTILLV